MMITKFKEEFFKEKDPQKLHDAAAQYLMQLSELEGLEDDDIGQAIVICYAMAAYTESRAVYFLLKEQNNQK